METSASYRDLSLLLDEADRAAARLARSVGAARVDREDLRQELLADLIRRLPAFVASRGTLGAFAGAILRNHASRLATRAAREREMWNGGLLSLDTPGRDGEGLGDELSGDVSLPGWQHGLSAVSATEARIDIGRAMATLTDAESALFASAAHASVQDLVDHGFGARATLYRRLRDLRCVLTAGGLGGLSDSFVAA